MDILNQIAAEKRREIQLKKQWVSEQQLSQHTLFSAPTRSLKRSLLDKKTGIIAEHKRRSPSRAVINQKIALPDVVKGYEDGGAAGISVLTDGTYFGGSLEDLLLARGCTQLPLLRKEFIVDSYQIYEARAYGADAILLIAALLNRDQVARFTELAHQLNLEVLLEVHNASELEQTLVPGLDLIGVNNRNLKTFEVSLDTSKALAPLIPQDALKISESGLASFRELQELKAVGYHGFLMGEAFMKNDRPGLALESLLKECNYEG